MKWDVETSPEFDTWFEALRSGERELVAAGILHLQQYGPTAARPWFDTLSGSAYPNLKELRLPGTNIRILFAFDPRRTAYLMLGGDKTGQWTKWYRTAIPQAERIDRRHLSGLKD